MRLQTFVGVLGLAVLSIVARQGYASTEITVVQQFDPTQGQLPESVARDQNGDLVLSMAPQHALWKFAPDGEYPPVPFATLPVAEGASSIGVKIDEDGDIFACTAALDPTLDASHVWRVSPYGTVSHYASLDANGFPNDIAIDDCANLFVTDPVLGAVYKIAEDGTATTWLDDERLQGDPTGPIVGVPWGANGIAFDRRDRHLYISNTDLGEIYRVRVLRNGWPGRFELFASDPLLVGADGIAFDYVGRLYIAVNAQNSIARLDRRGNVTIVAQGGPFDGPSSMAFASDGVQTTQLYITSFALGTALGGGIPQPSLDSITVPFGGLPLP